MSAWTITAEERARNNAAPCACHVGHRALRALDVTDEMREALEKLRRDGCICGTLDDLARDGTIPGPPERVCDACQTAQPLIARYDALVERPATPSASDSAPTPDLGAPDGATAPWMEEVGRPITPEDTLKCTEGGPDGATAAGAGEAARSRLEGNAPEQPNAERPTVGGAGPDRLGEAAAMLDRVLENAETMSAGGGFYGDNVDRWLMNVMMARSVYRNALAAPSNVGQADSAAGGALPSGRQLPSGPPAAGSREATPHEH